MDGDVPLGDLPLLGDGTIVVSTGCGSDGQGVRTCILSEVFCDVVVGVVYSLHTTDHIGQHIAEILVVSIVDVVTGHVQHSVGEGPLLDGDPAYGLSDGIVGRHIVGTALDHECSGENTGTASEVLLERIICESLTYMSRYKTVGGERIDALDLSVVLETVGISLDGQ